MRAPEFWTREDAGARKLAAALSPLGWLYGASVAYKAAHTASFRPRARVVCVGNLTVGGSGKTPVAIALARSLIALGKRVVFLSRGYGGRNRNPLLIDAARMSATDVGDEPLLLARAAPTIVSRDRKAGAELADAGGFDVIIMDDGHQNFALEKDLCLVVVDAEAGFGNGKIVPAGPLREPVAQGLARADAVVLSGDGAPPLAAFNGPMLRGRLLPGKAQDWHGRRVVAFAGIGRPEKFYASLRSAGAVLCDTRDYGDHHAYTAAEIARLRARARALDAALVTTEKDFVRLAPSHRDGIATLPVEMQFEDAAALAALLSHLILPAEEVA